MDWKPTLEPLHALGKMWVMVQKFEAKEKAGKGNSGANLGTVVISCSILVVLRNVLVLSFDIVLFTRKEVECKSFDQYFALSDRIQAWTIL